MGKQILLVRHCEAESQAVEAPLTKKREAAGAAVKIIFKKSFD
ncbi:hypothetical protein RWE15_08020 [Virgibacillus halophilus]|uniref:2,3-bisphosphoglycerate-dependent phosphoglycerate mutase n=1 Tax=Tigheibacillus halophilus TaxID=361280 RepID=A0ABU5C4Z9_9BACI|nr:hypothetical protein [Virgibacillus halophilus]